MAIARRKQSGTGSTQGGDFEGWKQRIASTLANEFGWPTPDVNSISEEHYKAIWQSRKRAYDDNGNPLNQYGKPYTARGAAFKLDGGKDQSTGAQQMGFVGWLDAIETRLTSAIQRNELDTSVKVTDDEEVALLRVWFDPFNRMNAGEAVEFLMERRGEGDQVERDEVSQEQHAPAFTPSAEQDREQAPNEEAEHDAIQAAGVADARTAPAEDPEANQPTDEWLGNYVGRCQDLGVDSPEYVVGDDYDLDTLLAQFYAGGYTPDQAAQITVALQQAPEGTDIGEEIAKHLAQGEVTQRRNGQPIEA